LDWLEADWVFDTDTMAFDKKKDPTHQSSFKSSKFQLDSGACLGSITI
jgi:hypothetical protein